MEHSYDLRTDVADHIELDALSGVDVAIIPDNLLTTSSGMVAGYRPETQSLRVFLREQGLSVALATPTGARTASYEEHDATWVLPLLLSIPAGVVSGVLSTYVTDWLKRERKKVPDEEAQAVIVRYREAELVASTGKIVVRELEAPLDTLIEVLETRERESLPPGRS